MLPPGDLILTLSFRRLKLALQTAPEGFIMSLIIEIESWKERYQRETVAQDERRCSFRSQFELPVRKYEPFDYSGTSGWQPVEKIQTPEPRSLVPWIIGLSFALPVACLAYLLL